MTMAVAAVVALAQQCAPSVAPETLVSLVHAESRFNPLAIGVNAKGVIPPAPRDRTEAAASARALIAQGYNIDLGLGQINSANLARLGLSIEDAFDPCRNLAASARVLATNYLSVARTSASTEAAIATAMSMYNTGNRWRGFGNGYVGKVYASSAVIVPAIHGLPPVARPVGPAPQQLNWAPPRRTAALTTHRARWDTAADTQTASLMVFGGQLSTKTKGLAE